jgi:predicted PurR-regulated permease PerM
MEEKTHFRSIDIYLRILLVTGLLVWCILIARPFLVIIVWAIIIAVSIYPVYKKLLKWYKGKRGLAVSTFLVIILVAVIIPSLRLGRTILRHTKEIQTFLADPEAQFPRPNEKVKEWPVVGNDIYSYWTGAYSNLESFINEHNEEVQKVLGWLLKGLGTVLTDVFISMISLVLAGFLLYTSESMFNGLNRFTTRLIGEGMGRHYVLVARDTIRSVVEGVILVAIIQAVLAYFGFLVMGIKGAALFAVLILILAIMQMPIMLITVPVAIYAFAIASGPAAILFAVYMLFLGVIDNILKPIFLGRGVDVPLLIIFIGSLGGLVLHGILGLFLGAVVLAIGYQTYMLWIDNNENVKARAQQN